MKESTAKVQTVPTIVCIVGGSGSAGPADATLRVAGPNFPSAQALVESAVAPDAVLLYPSNETQAAEWAIALRGSTRHYMVPLFTTRAWNDVVAELVDGVVVDSGQMLRSIAAIQERQAVLPERPALDSEERLLAFLFTRPDQIIRPICQWQAEHVYSYPLLDAFAPAGAEGFTWSAALRRRSLLEPVELVDRVRQCPSCSGAHLNFVDVCPQCSSVDIAETVFLHCHTCGHVAEQAAFLSHHSLSCPKCNAALRHIGVDYDRALEAFSCAPCRGRFTEPEVKARCLHCQTLSKTEQLQARRIDSLRLSEAGQLAVRTGHVGELFALIDEFHCAHPAYFEETLEFLLNLGRRHAEIEFGLVCMRFTNVRDLLDRLPRVQVSQMIDGVATRLRELVRTTDLVLRSDDEHCWLLLPQTPQTGVEILISRIRKIPDAAAISSARIDLSIASISSHALKDKGVSAPLVMAELRSQVQ
jgi:GGDEF domain-containing protein